VIVKDVGENSSQMFQVLVTLWVKWALAILAICGSNPSKALCSIINWCPK